MSVERARWHRQGLSCRSQGFPCGAENSMYFRGSRWVSVTRNKRPGCFYGDEPLVQAISDCCPPGSSDITHGPPGARPYPWLLSTLHGHRLEPA